MHKAIFFGVAARLAGGLYLNHRRTATDYKKKVKARGTLADKTKSNV